MDFRYQLDGQLRAPLIRALQDAGEKYIDAVKVRALEDSWKPSNFQSSQSLQKLLSELNDLEIPVLESHLKNKYWIPLTNNTLTFSKLFVVLLEDCLNVTTPEINSIVEAILISVLRLQVKHLQVSLTNPKFKQEVIFQFLKLKYVILKFMI